MEQIMFPGLKIISENWVRDYGFSPWIRINYSFANGRFLVCFFNIVVDN